MHLDASQLLEQFVAADRAGEDPDPREFLRRMPETERPVLEALLDAYLARAPRRAFDAAAFAGSPAERLATGMSRSLDGRAGLWPSLLPRLRERARIRRADLVARLAAELGAAGREEKVAGYYHRMEQGTLPSAGVSDRVLEALGRIVGESAAALRRAGEAVGEAVRPPAAGGPAAAPMFTRVGEPDEDLAALVPPAAAPAAPASPGTRDEIDELFTGRSDPGAA